MSFRSGCRWGRHDQFAKLYEDFLDAVYPPPPGAGQSSGRELLTASIVNHLRTRKARSVLDCAAGTGLPALDLAAQGIDIHCSDGDPAMIAVLAAQAAEGNIDIRDLAPPRRPGYEGRGGTDDLVLNWTQLEWITRRYDYVLCRGNSLAYADTWAGKTKVANEQLVGTYLERITRKVRPGGHLHIDAPWKLELPTQSYRPVDGPTGAIWEEVTPGDNHREWVVSFKPSKSGRPLAFRRYSTLLTIDRIETMLKALGFETTEPFQMAAERPGFGVIIARKPMDHRDQQSLAS